MPPPEGEGNHRRARAQMRRQEERPSNQQRGISGKPLRSPPLASHRFAGKTKKKRTRNGEKPEGDKWHRYHLCFCGHGKV